MLPDLLEDNSSVDDGTPDTGTFAGKKTRNKQPNSKFSNKRSQLNNSFSMALQSSFNRAKEDDDNLLFNFQLKKSNIITSQYTNTHQDDKREESKDDK